MEFLLSLRDGIRHRNLFFLLFLTHFVLSPAYSQTFGTPYAANYTAVDLGSFGWTGLAFSPGNPNQLVFDTSSGLNINFFTVSVTRGTGDHITGFGTPQQFATVNAADGPAGGFIFAPNGTLLFTYANSENIVGEIKSGSSSLSMNATVANIGTNRISGLALIPSEFTGAGQLLFSSFDSRDYYSSALSPTGSGTYNILNANVVTTNAHDPFGGIVYVPNGSPDFPVGAIITADGDGLFTYNVNASGYPILSTEQTFFTDQGFFAGATIDPLTGDLLTSSGGLLFDIQGFTAPIQPTNFTASASGNWNDSTLWTPNGVPNGTNNIANLVLPASGTNAINLQGGSFTLNQLNIVGTGQGAWTVTNGTLIFDGTSPIFTNQSTAAGVNAILGVSLQLNQNTTFETENAGAITEVSGAIGGNGKLIVTGAGKLILTNSNNYSGGTLINGHIATREWRSQWNDYRECRR